MANKSALGMTTTDPGVLTMLKLLSEMLRLLSEVLRLLSEVLLLDWYSKTINLPVEG